jgi:hypothetical protein
LQYIAPSVTISAAKTWGGSGVSKQGKWSCSYSNLTGMQMVYYVTKYTDFTTTFLTLKNHKVLRHV